MYGQSQPQPVVQPGQYAQPQYAPPPGYQQPPPVGYQQAPPPGYPAPQGYAQPQPGYASQGAPVMVVQQPGLAINQNDSQQPLQAPQELSSGQDVLENLTAIIVKQKPQYLETFTGCEFENKYNVYSYNDGKKGSKLFKCREKSSCMARHCLAADCRPFDVFVLKKKPSKGPFLRFERDYACTCMCCNRPYMRVYYTEESLKNWDGGVLKGTDQDLYLGKVHDPYHCCNLTLETFDDENKKDYYISGSCCQCGLYCHWPCGPCQRVVFKIFDSNNEEVGSIEKVWSSCVKEIFSNADNFIAYFPAKSTWKQKALLLGATLMIDFRYFEDRQKNRNNQGGGAF